MYAPIVLRGLLLCVVLFSPIVADAAPATVISRIPYENVKPGRYVLARSFTYQGEGAAITLSADNVVLDLQDGYSSARRQLPPPPWPKGFAR